MAIAINNQLTTITNHRDPPITKWDTDNCLTLHDVHHFGCLVSVLATSNSHNKLNSQVRMATYLRPARGDSTHHHMLINGKVIKS
jgi:hypothetical protein